MAKEEVLNWKELGNLGPEGACLAVLGDPIHHSLSPAMHRAALDALAERDPQFQNWSYRAIHVPAVELSEAIPELYAQGFRGINLTLPHKVDVLPLLPHVDAEAEQMGAVNTLVRQENGFHGFNSDGYGILKAIKETLEIGVEGRSVYLLGAGGAARAIAVACLNGGCSELTVVNRSQERLNALLERLIHIGGGRVHGVSSQDFEGILAEGSLVINATSLGLKEDDPSPLPEQALVNGILVYDTTYGCINALNRLCAARGISYSDGLSMLVWQGVRSLEIWTGAEIPAEVMASAAREALASRHSS